jgi:predicted N-formylglutamate amidohydrolase
MIPDAVTTDPMRKPSSPRYNVLLTCEHAGNKIPREYAGRFAGAEQVLASHRGWDPGALDFVRGLSRSLRTPFHHVLWSRLLVEANRSPNNRRIWSRYMEDLPAAEKQTVLQKYWWPHRRAVERSVRDATLNGNTVLHIAIHSFTHNLDGVERHADLALLYDCTRAEERSLCMNWQIALNRLDPNLRVRRNYPYQGKSDGLPTWLRKKFPEQSYLGIEFEFNQALVGTPGFAKARSEVAKSISTIMSGKVNR